MYTIQYKNHPLLGWLTVGIVSPCPQPADKKRELRAAIALKIKFVRDNCGSGQCPEHLRDAGEYPEDLQVYEDLRDVPEDEVGLLVIDRARAVPGQRLPDHTCWDVWSTVSSSSRDIGEDNILELIASQIEENKVLVLVEGENPWRSQGSYWDPESVYYRRVNLDAPVVVKVWDEL